MLKVGEFPAYRSAGKYCRFVKNKRQFRRTGERFVQMAGGLSRQETPCLSVIILNYNGAGFLRDCIRSVLSQDYPNTEVILVDNGSADESCSIVEKEFPLVKLLKLDRNYHFSGGMNRGVKASTGDIALLLNNDTVVQEHALTKAMRSITGMDIDICGCGILKLNGMRPQSSIHLYETLDFAGAAVFVRKSAWQDLGGIDEDFKTYFELKDFAIRAVLKGYKVMVEPEALIFHAGSVTTKKMSGYTLINMSRNFPMLVFKNFRLPVISAIMLSYCTSRGALIIKLAVRRQNDDIRYRLKGSLEFVRMLPEIIEKRKAVQSTRVTGDRKVVLLRDKPLLKIGIDGGF